MSLTAPLHQHRTRWLCVFSFVFVLVAQLEAESEDISNLKARSEKGDAEAQFELGILYKDGQGFEQNLSEAATWFRKAAEQGFAKAQNNLGVMYRKGQGGKPE